MNNKLILELLRVGVINPYRKRLTIGYFGSHARFAREMLSFCSLEYSKYIDMTAGGLGMLYYYLINGGKAIVANDLNYYSYVFGKAIFNGHGVMISPWDIDELFRQIEPMSGKFSIDFFKDMKSEVSGWIDGAIHYAQRTENYMFLASLMKYILMEFTWHGLNFTPKTSSGTLVKDITTHDVMVAVGKNIIRYSFHAMAMRGCSAYMSWNCANNFVKEYDGFKNAFVLVDPAWPWKKEKMVNPYIFLCETFPSYFYNGLMPKGTIPWTNHNLDVILADLTLWVTTAMEKGAGRFVVNTQDTNFPSSDVLTQFFHDTFGVFHKVAGPSAWNVRKDSDTHTSKLRQFIYTIDRK